MLLALGHECLNDVQSQRLACIVGNFKYWGYASMLDSQVSNYNVIDSYAVWKENYCELKRLFVD